MAGIGDGVSEGLGRIRREMHRVRSPQLLPRSDSSLSGPVPLEFDEEDEDFVTRDVDDDDGSGSGLQVPTTRHRDETSTSRGTSRDVDEEIWSANGWDQQDESAIDEAEQFDDLSAVGYLD
ncbi:hypothetical protein BYT27DRAFT_7007668, partial [Phlegmacium glaucopus]